jgi:hypothetical protein
MEIHICCVSRKNFEYKKYSITHQYDVGAAWENLALEASSRELVVHGTQGFDYEKARIDLEVHDSFDVMVRSVTTTVHKWGKIQCNWINNQRLKAVI